jgi:hypothetical protein
VTLLSEVFPGAIMSLLSIPLLRGRPPWHQAPEPSFSPSISPYSNFVLATPVSLEACVRMSARDRSLTDLAYTAGWLLHTGDAVWGKDWMMSLLILRLSVVSFQMVWVFSYSQCYQLAIKEDRSLLDSSTNTVRHHPPYYSILANSYLVVLSY